MKLDVVLRRLATSPEGGLSGVAVRSLICLAPLVVIRLLLMPIMAPASGMTAFVPAVLVASLWAGWRGGVLTSLLGGAISTGLYAAGHGPGGFDVERYLLSILLFGMNCAFAVPFGTFLRLAMRRLAEAAEAEIEHQARLTASEARFRTLAENAPVMLWMGDPEGRCVHLNRALREFWGVREDLAGFDLAQMVHPEDAEAMFAVAGPATARGEAFEIEARYRRADGAWRIMTTHAQPRYASDGAYEGMTGVNVDVTEAREAEAALRESERRFRTMADAAPAPIWISDETSGIEFGNRALVDMLGGDAEAMKRRAWIERVHPDDLPALMAERERAHPKRLPYGFEARFRNAAGDWRWIRAVTSPRFGDHGAFLGYVGIGFDVTEARAAADALRESEERFRAMADSAPSPVWVSGAEGGIEFGNRAMIDFFGDVEKTKGLGWLEILDPEARETALEMRRRALEERQPFAFEARFRNAAGEWRWMRASTQPRFGPDGGFLGYVGIAFDVTEARQAAEALKAQERRHAFLLELGDSLRDLETPGDIMTTAMRLMGQHVGVARAGYGEVEEDGLHVVVGGDWTDGSSASTKGRYLMDDFGPELGRDLRAGITVPVADVAEDPRTAPAAAAFAALDVRSFIRVPLVRSGRLRAFLFLHSRERRDWTDKEVALAEEVADRIWTAVERVRAEIELKESEARFRSIADSAPVLIWVTRADRRRAFVNVAYVEFMGGDYESALAADWREHLHPEDLDRVIAESVAGEATGEPFMLEARYRRFDGAWRWLRSYSRPRLDSRGELLGFVGVAYDVTEARKVERDLTHINELLEVRVAEALAEKDKAEAALLHAQRMEAVGRLTGGVAHDFNNLLTVVIGALDMAGRAGDPARRDRLIEAALAAARRGERLTHQLLAFSRRQALRPQVTDINAVIAEGEPLLRRAVGEAVALDLSLEPGAPAVHIDPAHFEAALINLIVNARDATPDGGWIEVSTRVVTLGSGEKEGASAGDHVRVQVRDTGAGMPPEVRERVFEPFFTTKPVGKGTGLGLSQVYGFVRQSGGAVEIDSEIGQGTTVSLYLPAAAEAPRAAAERSAVAAVETRPFEGVRVLLVEDDAEVAAICGDMLSGLGLKVDTAPDAAEALRALKRRRFDLLLTDLIMPGGVNGVELARQATKARPELRVLLASGYAGEAVDRALADAPWPLLPKPYDAETLAAAVTRALRRDQEG